MLNVTFLILRQRNVHLGRMNDVKVKRKPDRKIVNEIDTDRERLLSEETDEGQRSRACSKTKLLGHSQDGAGDRMYSSCSDCTGNCEEISRYDPKG